MSTDQQRFKQVLLNFQSNALKFTPRGGSINIHCTYLGEAGPHGSIKVEVIDTGIGISKANQKNLFQLYGFIKDSSELNPQGVGLGLHICKSICS